MQSSGGCWQKSRLTTHYELFDRGGGVSFVGTDYQAGRRWARQSIDVSIVAGSVQLSKGGKVIGVHPIRPTY